MIAGPRSATERDGRSSARLARRPCAVGELARELPVSRPAVSQHLKVLKDAGLVTDRADGNRRIYQVNPTACKRCEPTSISSGSAPLRASKRPSNNARRRLHDALAEATSIRHQVTVDAPIERAFAVFTEDFGSFKPREHNMLAVDIAETVFEPRAGGRLFDRGVDGSECQWARVLAYEPPDRVVISWDISPHWQIETDLEKTSEVEVRFIAEGPDRTRVELEHRNLDRHLDGWQGLREGVDSGDGWPLYLRRYAELLAASST